AEGAGRGLARRDEGGRGKRAGAGATVRAARCVPVAVWRGPRESPHAERLSRRVWGGARCAPDAGVGGDAASRVGAARASDPGWHAGPCEWGGGVVPTRGWGRWGPAAIGPPTTCSSRGRWRAG